MPSVEFECVDQPRCVVLGDCKLWAKLTTGIRLSDLADDWKKPQYCPYTGKKVEWREP